MLLGIVTLPPVAIAIEEGGKIKETSNLLVSKYKAKIDDAVSNKYMAKSSGEAFMKEFTKDCDLGEKMDWDSKFETHELAKRKAVTEQFRNEVPKDLQEANQDFYELSYTDRTERLAKLLGVDVDAVNDKAEAKEGTEKAQRIERLSNDANRLEREGMTAENRDAKKEKWTQALHTYQKLLKIDPEDDIAQSNYDRLISKYNKAFPNEGIPAMDEEDEITEQQFDAMLDRATTGSVMEENKKRLNIMKELVDREHTSENKNNQTFDTTKKQGRFQTEFERELNAKLVEHTDGEKIMNRDGKAQEVQQVDIRKMGSLEQNQVYNLQRQVTQTRGEKATKVDHIQFADEQSGQKMNANTARELLKKEEAKVKKEGQPTNHVMLLNVCHPNIQEFLNYEQHHGKLQNFTMMVEINEKFMLAVEAGHDLELMNPVNQKVTATVSSKAIFDQLTKNSPVVS